MPSPPSLRARSSAPRDIPALAGWLAATFAAANAGEFYASLARPPWAPPSSLFGPVWTVLYILIGVAAWLVWRRRGFRGARGALTYAIWQRNPQIL